MSKNVGLPANRTSDTQTQAQCTSGKLKLCVQQKFGKNVSVGSILRMLLDSGKVDYVAGLVGVV